MRINESEPAELHDALVRPRALSRWKLWAAVLVMLGSATAVVAVAVTYPFAERMPVHSEARPKCGPWCRNASAAAPCVYDGECTSSHGHDFCLMDCGRWRAGADVAVPHCSCSDFCGGACWAPSCVPCQRDCLPLWIRDTPSPLGTGILCCPGCADPCEPCCGNHSVLGRCCELRAPPQGCTCADPPPTLSQIMEESSGRLKQALLPLVVLAVIAPALCAWATVDSTLWSPRTVCGSSTCSAVVCWPQQMLLLSSLALTVALQLLLKAYDWDARAKPRELLLAAASGTTAVMLWALALAPSELRISALRSWRLLSYNRAVVVHRTVGQLAVAAVVCHAALEVWVHLATSLQTRLRERQPHALLGAVNSVAAVVFGRGLHAWGLGNVFGVVAACSLLVSMLGVTLRRWLYEAFTYTHAPCALLALLAACLHAFELIPVRHAAHAARRTRAHACAHSKSGPHLRCCRLVLRLLPCLLPCLPSCLRPRVVRRATTHAHRASPCSVGRKSAGLVACSLLLPSAPATHSNARSWCATLADKRAALLSSPHASHFPVQPSAARDAPALLRVP